MHQEKDTMTDRRPTPSGLHPTSLVFHNFPRAWVCSWELCKALLYYLVFCNYQIADQLMLQGKNLYFWIHSFPKPSHPSAGKSPLASRYSRCCATYCSVCSSPSVAWKNTTAGFRAARECPQPPWGLSASTARPLPSSICKEVWEVKNYDSHFQIEMAP